MSAFSSLEIIGLCLIAGSELAILISPFFYRFFAKAQKETPNSFPPVKRIAAIICAHNEDSTIAGLLSILNRQTRLADTVYVVADNCADKTADIARSMGAVVLEKGPSGNGGGKAYALRFVLEKVMQEDFDGFVFFDADTIPNDAFIEHAVEDLNQAEMVIGYHSFENRPDTWAEAGNALLGHILWHYFLRPRYNSGVHTLVFGMGYALRRSFLERVNWKPETLTEDLALSIDAALAHSNSRLCTGAQFQDKQPETWAVSWHRMRRWMTGDMQCLKTYFLPLVKYALHRNPKAWDFLFFLLSVPGLFLKACGLLCMIATACTGNWRMLAIILGYDLFSTICAVLIKHKQIYLRGFSIPAFFCFYCQLPWIALSSFLIPTKHWVPGRKAPCTAMKNAEKQA